MYREVRAAIARYVRGKWTLDELRRWRRAHIQPIHDAGDADAYHLYLDLAAVLAEYSIGDRSEAGVRAALREAIGEPEVATAHTAPAAS